MLDRSYWTLTKMAFLLLVALGFCEPWLSVGAWKLAKPVIMGPSAGELNTITDFTCWVEDPQNVSLIYQLFRQDDMKKVLGFYTAPSGESVSIPSLLTFKYDGRLTCKASGHNNSDIEPSYSDWLDFRVIDPVDGAFIVSTLAPGDLWEGERLTLQCNISKGNYVSYSWYLNDMPVQWKYNMSQSELTIQHVSMRDSGKYVCTASNQVNDTLIFSNRSHEIYVHVKEHVSKPGISFDAFMDVKKNLTADVTCELAKGSPPINFTLLIGSQAIAEKPGESLRASFMIPILLDQDMGLAQCQASNGKRVMKSEKLNVTVESVGGAVTMRLKKAEGPFFQVLGVWLHCGVERGTFPHFSWFLNNSKLEGIGPYYSVFGKDHSGLSLSLGPVSAGMYHCEAVNKFSNATRLRSQKSLITKKGLNRVPAVVAAIVFTCFSVLIVAVTTCCLYGVLRRRRAGRYKLNQYLSEMSNIVDDREKETNDYSSGRENEYGYENEEGVYDNIEGVYDEEDNVGVVGEYREDTDTEQPSTIEDSDEGEEEVEANKDPIAI